MAVERISTGISGLDALIEGGFPKGFTILIAGNPGTGKTVLTSHFLYNGLIKNENGLYVSFSEADYSFYKNTERFGMKFREFQKQNRVFFFRFFSRYTGRNSRCIRRSFGYNQRNPC